MDRIIIFRGYSESLERFVYGSYLYMPKFIDKKLIEHWIVNDEGFKYAIENKKSIGQYTGLESKNGLKIYEGDIVKGGCRYPFSTDIGIVRYGEFEADNSADEYTHINCLGWYIEPISDFEYHGEFNNNDLEVIGNEFENPELLSEVSHE